MTERAPDDGPARRRRRAVGPPGASTGDEPAFDLEGESAQAEDDERLRRDRPPHHDRGL